MDQFRGNRHI